jgi:glucose-1-phosphate adenylyltransferase
MDVFTIVLAGGMGKGLSELASVRAKPVVPVGGKYRLIDFVLSNAANSGLERAALLAQYRPESLTAHVGDGAPWGFAPGACQIWLPSVERTGREAYLGTADAVYQNRRFIAEQGCQWTLIISGDHLYVHDYRDLIRFHQQHGAALTIAAQPVPETEAQRFGMIQAGERHQVTSFVEKPASAPAGLASLGIYVFNTTFLLERLEEDARLKGSKHDFGRDILPRIVEEGQACAYPMATYWADVGTLETYWRTNLALLGDEPILDLADPGWPVMTRLTQKAPLSVRPAGWVSDSLVSEGCLIAGEVVHSVLSPGVRVERGAVVRDSVILEGTVVRAGAVVSACVVDEAVEVGEQARLGAGEALTPNESEPELLKGGLTLVGKGARIPAGARIGRNCLVGIGVGPEDFEGMAGGVNVPGGRTVTKQ